MDYTEEEIRELANVKLEKFLDPRGVRSDLLDQFRRSKAAMPAPQNFAFEDDTLYETHRGLIRWIRKLLNPLLKLFFNPNPLIQALHIQSELNTRNAKREELDALHYEVMHNLVLELTRLGIEVKNLKMRVESMSSRLDFDERRARALEGVVHVSARRGRRRCSRRRRRAAAARPAARAIGRTPHARRRRRRATPPSRRAGERVQAEPGRGETGAHGAIEADAGRPRRRRRRRSAAGDLRRSREARDRGSALRRRHQRRRRAARALHRRAAGAARRRRGRDDLRARLRHLAERAAGRASSSVNGVAVRRFPVRHERVPREFGRLSERVFEQPHSIADELAWLESEGPASPAMIDYLADGADSTSPSCSAIATTTPGTRARRLHGQGAAGADRGARSGDRA